jgi:hypothetical protein
MFGEIKSDQHLMPYDSTALHIVGHPEPVADSLVATVKFIHGDPILPSVSAFLLADVTSRDGVKVGDEFMIFEPHHKSDVSGAPADPEIAIARAQVVRVTPYGSTLMIVNEKHAKIEPGSPARRVAAMP